MVWNQVRFSREPRERINVWKMACFDLKQGQNSQNRPAHLHREFRGGHLQSHNVYEDNFTFVETDVNNIFCKNYTNPKDHTPQTTSDTNHLLCCL